MATFVTNFADSSQFHDYAFENGLVNAFTDGGLSSIGELFDSFSLGDRSVGGSDDETTSHRTGFWDDNSSGLYDGGNFHAVGTLATPT